jgi:uncharacterized protein YcbK (DUF882 family)
MDGYFTENEMKCHCCGQVHMNTDFMIRLNKARGLAGVPWIIDSGYRCLKHNAAIGSTSDNHVVGKAADIRCMESYMRFTMVSCLEAVGMTGIGIAEDFIHADTNRKIGLMWVYKPKE